MRSITLFFVVFIFCCSISANDLTLTLETADSLVSSRNVTISISFKNDSDSNIVLYCHSIFKMQRAMGGFLFFDIIRDDKDTLICSVAGAVPKYPHKSDTTIVAPNHEYTESINLASYYVSIKSTVEPEWDSTNAIGNWTWEPGDYKIRCRYEYQHKPNLEGGKNLWRGSATSAEITVKIEK